MLLKEGQVRIPAGCAISGIFHKDGKKENGERIIKSISTMHDRSNGLGGGFAAYGIYPEFKNDYAFERAIISWGTLTGVLITGMTLLKICDPEYKSPALTEFSLGFSLMSVTGLLIVPILNTVLAVGSTWDNLVTAVITSAAYLAFTFIVYFIHKKSNA